jgi:hypothetical protein
VLHSIVVHRLGRPRRNLRPQVDFLGDIRPEQQAAMMEPILQAFLDSGGKYEILFVCALAILGGIYYEIFEQFFDT